MKTIFVKRVTKEEVENNWKTRLPQRVNYILYARCSNLGNVNWNKTEIFTKSQLERRGKYNEIVTDNSLTLVFSQWLAKNCSINQHSENWLYKGQYYTTEEIYQEFLNH